MAGDDPAATTEQPSSDGADDPAARDAARDAERNAVAPAAELPAALSAAAHPITLAPTVPARPAPDPRTAARAHLRTVRHASAELARALMDAGYPPHRWQAPDPTLRELARALPQPSLAALFARLDRFSGEDGPTWLAGDSTAIAAFTSEAHLLDGILRPLRALALRRRAGSSPDHPTRPLERILADPDSGAELDRLAQAVDALAALAPALAPAPAEPAPRLVPVLAPHSAPPRPEPAPHPPRAPTRADPGAAGQADVPTVIAEDAPTIPAETPFMPGAVVDMVSDRMPATHPSAARPPVLPDAPTVPWLPAGATVPLPPGKMPRPRQRLQLAPRLPRLSARWRGPYLLVALGIAACLACAVVSIVLTFAPTAGLSPRATPATTTIVPTAHATQTHAVLTATPIPATSTPVPAHLTVTPTFINLACPFTGEPSTLTLRDTGGASLTWQIANPPGALFFSATSGSLAPGASGAVQVRAVWRQHGTHSFTVSSNGGPVTVSYTVCR